MFYNPSNWYWSGQPVGQPATVTYSSSRNALVAATDAAYVAWLAQGNTATPWPKDETGVATYAELDAVLTAANLPITGLAALTVDQLQAYADAKLAAYGTGDLTVNIGTTTAPINVLVDVSAAGRANVLGLDKDFANGAATETWYQSIGSVVITQPQLAIIELALKVYVQSSLAVWQTASAGIRSTPATLTTTTQIDALAWPALAGA